MRTIRPVLPLIVAALALGFTANGATAQTSINASKHDLAVGGADNGEICVYCHTPHAANAAVSAPLWNKPASGATYTTYDSNLSSTLDGTVLAVGSVSVACLSCHDGTQAMDSVINAPGTNGFNALGARMGADPVLGGGVLAGDGTIGTVGTNQVANLGSDLRNDHPIGILYGGFDRGGTLGVADADFKTPASGLINGTTQWWVDTGVAGLTTREKSDMILYARLNGTASQPFVECASCHDPHNPANGTFLRVSNANSDVCLSCHVK